MVLLNEKSVSYWETSGKNQVRVMAGKPRATSTNKVNQEGKRTGSKGTRADKLKGSSAGGSREGVW